MQTNRITTKATIKILRSLFARLGMPKLLVSDNGIQFKSAEFAHFCNQNGIEHNTTAPFHPQSKEFAERFVDMFKRGIKKIQEGKGQLHESLYGRRIRTNLDLPRPPANHQQIMEGED